MGIETSVAFLTGSPADWAIIMVVALLLFGPKKLPEVGKQLGQAMREFRKMTDELTGAAHSVRDGVESVWHAPTDRWLPGASCRQQPYRGGRDDSQVRPGTGRPHGPGRPRHPSRTP